MKWEYRHGITCEIALPVRSNGFAGNRDEYPAND
jgi:hypothetical protein